MSSRMVRSELRNRIKSVAQSMPNPKVPFFDTLNGQEPPAGTTEWITATFSSTSTEDICADKGATQIENGLCYIYVFTRTGIGDDRACEIIEHFEKHFRLNPADPTNPKGTVIESVDAPDEAWEGDTRKWFSMYLPMSYMATKLI